MNAVNQDGENELRIFRCQECHRLYFGQSTQSVLVTVEDKTGLGSGEFKQLLSEASLAEFQASIPE